jgi:hypothetical protein
MWDDSEEYINDSDSEDGNPTAVRAPALPPDHLRQWAKNFGLFHPFVWEFPTDLMIQQKFRPTPEVQEIEQVGSSSEESEDEEYNDDGQEHEDESESDTDSGRPIVLLPSRARKSKPARRLRSVRKKPPPRALTPEDILTPEQVVIHRSEILSSYLFLVTEEQEEISESIQMMRYYLSSALSPQEELRAERSLRQGELEMQDLQKEEKMLRRAIESGARFSWEVPEDPDELVNQEVQSGEDEVNDLVKDEMDEVDEEEGQFMSFLGLMRSVCTETGYLYTVDFQIQPLPKKKQKRASLLYASPLSPLKVVAGVVTVSL